MAYNNRNAFSQSSEVQESEIKVSGGWFLSKALRENPSHVSFLASAGNPRHPLACMLYYSSLCHCMYVPRMSVSTPPLFSLIRTPVIGYRFQPTAETISSEAPLINYICPVAFLFFFLFFSPWELVYWYLNTIWGCSVKVSALGLNVLCLIFFSI